MAASKTKSMKSRSSAFTWPAGINPADSAANAGVIKQVPLAFVFDNGVMVGPALGRMLIHDDALSRRKLTAATGSPRTQCQTKKVVIGCNFLPAGQTTK
ncbi:MAG: hypothetical protein JXA73_19890 [Acidobacteria bacterium]|nr:hypothetical protein [Acidobacteriota bacterium]